MKKILTFISLIFTPTVMANEAKIGSLFNDIPGLVFDSIYSALYSFADQIKMFTPEGNVIITICFALGAVLQLKKLFLDSNTIDFKEMLTTTLWFIFLYSCMWGGHYRQAFPNIWKNADSVSSGALSGAPTLDRDIYNVVKYYANIASDKLRSNSAVGEFKKVIYYNSIVEPICAREVSDERMTECLKRFKNKNLYAHDPTTGLPTEDAVNSAMKEFIGDQNYGYTELIRPLWHNTVSFFGFVPSGKIIFTLLIVFITAISNFVVYVLSILLQLVMVIEAVIILFFFKSLCPLVLWSGARGKVMGLFKTWLSFAILSFVFEVLMFITDTVAVAFYSSLSTPLSPIVALANIFPTPVGNYIKADPSLFGLAGFPPVAIVVYFFIGAVNLGILGLKLFFLTKLTKIAKGLMNLQFEELTGLAEGALKAGGQIGMMAAGAVATGGAGLIAAKGAMGAIGGGASKAMSSLGGAVSNSKFGQVASNLGGGLKRGLGMGGKKNLAPDSRMGEAPVLTNLSENSGGGNGGGGGFAQTDSPPVTEKENKTIPVNVMHTVGQNQSTSGFKPSNDMMNMPRPVSRAVTSANANLNDDNKGINLIDSNQKLSNNISSKKSKKVNTALDFDNDIGTSIPIKNKMTGSSNSLAEEKKITSGENGELLAVLSDIRTILDSIKNGGVKASGLSGGGSEEEEKAKAIGKKPKEKKTADWNNKDELDKDEASEIENMHKSIANAKPKNFIEKFKQDREKINNMLSPLTAMFSGAGEFSEKQTVGDSLNKASGSMTKLKEIQHKEALALFDTNNDGIVSKEELTTAYIRAKEKLGEGFKMSEMTFGLFNSVMEEKVVDIKKHSEDQEQNESKKK